MATQTESVASRLKGLTHDQVEASRQEHGANELTPPERDPWWKLYLEKFRDPVTGLINEPISTVTSDGFSGKMDWELTDTVAAKLVYSNRGYESQFATNHLGHFQLTLGLLPALRAAHGARVVNVASDTALTGCTGMDVVALLRKAGHPMDEFSVRAEGTLSARPPLEYVAAQQCFAISVARVLLPHQPRLEGPPALHLACSFPRESSGTVIAARR